MKIRNLILGMALVVVPLSMAIGQNPTQKVKSTGATIEKASSFLKGLSITSTLGTPSFSPSSLKQVKASSLKQFSLGQLGLSYQLGNHISVGFSTFGNLGNCQSGYTNTEGAFVSFDNDDHPDDDLNEIEDPNNPDHDMNETEDEDCDDDEIGQNVMGTITFTFSEKFPLFFQASGGYAFNQKAPAYTAMLGYRQKLFAGLGLVGGLRYSDVLHKTPADAVSVAPSAGVKAELGLNWKF